MTVAAVPITGFSVPPGVDRAVSAEAEMLRRLLGGVSEFPNSLTVGEPNRIIREALEAAWSACDETSPPLEPSTFAYADEFVRLLPSDVPVPEIVVDDDGEIMLEWDKGPRCVFSVSIGRDGTLSFAGLFGYDKVHGTEHLGDSLPAIISTCLKRISAAA